MHFHHGPSAHSRAPPSPPASASYTSSPPAGPKLSPPRTRRGKERRNPSVTPRRFGRFFTPRSSLSGGIPLRLPLYSLTGSETNRQITSPESMVDDTTMSDPLRSSPIDNTVRGGIVKRHCLESSSQVFKRRRGFQIDNLSLPQLKLPGVTEEMAEQGVSRSTADALGDRRKATLNLFFKASRSGLSNIEEKSTPLTPDVIKAGLADHTPPENYQPCSIRKFRNRGFESQLLDRQHGFSACTGRQLLASPACDPRAETASFYSHSNDVHQCVSYTSPGSMIPFSLASCHKAPVTAIGDEQGNVRLFDTTDSENTVEGKVTSYIRAHDNAIMDLAFSDDDLRLATACGDRSGKIIDVTTETVAVQLANNHFDSLRQVKFQRGQANDCMLATSDRSGRIQIWDLRCSTMPVNCFSAVGGPSGLVFRDTRLNPIFGKTVNTIDNSHERKVHGCTSTASVTALQWLPAGREHLILSASEANATIKLWDTRYIKPRRQLVETPLAMTDEPAGHAWRSYGITSMALSSDAARIYAVCKDSTVYAYSTAHLILGHAPALGDHAVKRKPAGVHGLGPLFGFRHEAFRAHSFYVKCAIRPSRAGNGNGSDLLAVGSSNSCAVLFPTDERYLRAAWDATAHVLPEDRTLLPAAATASPLTFSTSATPRAATTPQCSTPLTGTAAAATSSPPPIYRAGTALVRGHSREVTTMSWSYDGKLITASDDYLVRQWQQGACTARHLRTIGEFGGERHMSGWADVAADWDDLE